MHIALQRPIAAGRVRVQPTAGLDGEVRRLLHSLHGEIAGCLEDDRSLATHPGDDGRPVFVIMATAQPALLPATTCPTSQQLLATPCRLAFLAGGVIEVETSVDVCRDFAICRATTSPSQSTTRAFRQWYLRKVGDGTESELKIAIKKFFQFLAQDKGLTNEAVLKSLQR